MLIYNHKVGLPTIPQHLLDRDYQLVWTNHAIKAAADDNLDWENFGTVNLSKNQLIEQRHNAQTGALISLVVRLPFDEFEDCVLAVAINGPRLIVKTVWFNAVGDNHDNADTSAYARLPLMTES